MGIYTPPYAAANAWTHIPPYPTHVHINEYLVLVVEVFYPSLHTHAWTQYMDYTGLNLYQIWYLLRVLSQITTLTLTYFDFKPCKRSIYATSFKNCVYVVKYAVIYYCLFSFNSCFISSVLSC